MPARILALPPSQIGHAKRERDSARSAAKQSDSKPTAAQPIINGSESTDLEAATREFDKEARAIEQDPAKLAAMREEFDKEANRSAVKLAGDEHKTAQREILSAGDDLSNSLGGSFGASHPGETQARAVHTDRPDEKADLSPSGVIAK
ncbi:MAG: hypothetical protein ACRD4C_11220 [Candidatus Acidiferrales bacterium]